MPIKSFRGQIKDDDVKRIRLSTGNGMRGYKIHKFEVINAEPGTNHTEIIMKIYKTPQATPTIDVNFSDTTLLGVAYYEDSATAGSPGVQKIIFDNEVFNQDIYVTYKDNSNETVSNYYIELEQIPLNANSQAVVTLKDIRTNTV